MTTVRADGASPRRRPLAEAGRPGDGPRASRFARRVARRSRRSSSAWPSPRFARTQPATAGRSSHTTAPRHEVRAARPEVLRASTESTRAGQGSDPGGVQLESQGRLEGRSDGTDATDARELQRRRRSPIRSTPSRTCAAGVEQLAWCLRQYGGDIQLALAAYNAGTQARWRSTVAFRRTSETQRYLKLVGDLMSAAKPRRATGKTR